VLRGRRVPRRGSDHRQAAHGCVSSVSLARGGGAAEESVGIEERESGGQWS
jgi:hypothetical protein